MQSLCVTTILILTFIVAKEKVKNAIANTFLRICEGKSVKTKVPPNEQIIVHGEMNT